MNSNTIKATTIALLGAALIVFGQDRNPAPAPDGGVPPDGEVRKRTFGNGILSENVAVYDVDNSGALSVEEYQTLQTDRTRQGRHNTLRNRWDLNHDGRIDSRERSAATVRIRQLIEERRCRRFNEVDQNSDGFLTETEFLRINAVSATDLSNPGVGTDLFKYLDHNQDRRISKPEFLRSLNAIRTQAVDPGPTPKPRDDANNDDNPVRPVAP